MLLTSTQPDRLCLAVAELDPDYPPNPDDANLDFADDDSLGVPTYRRTPVDDVRAATLVSSLTRTGRHAPALDVDLPAALTVNDAGSTLWVCGLTARGWRRAVKALATAGLGPADRLPRRAPSRADRLVAYAADRPHAVDETERVAVLRAAGPTLDCSFAQAVELATSAAIPAGTVDRLPCTTGPELADPWPLRLAVPAMLLPSTRHHHLYLQVELDWNTYEDLLVDLGKARLLETGYVGASRARTATDLRLPWVHKTPEQLAAADAAKAAGNRPQVALLPAETSAVPAPF